MMMQWFEQLDRLLRGELTQMAKLRSEGLTLPLRGTTILLIFLGAIYGLCMGSFALLHADGPRFQQLLATTIKVPALFLLTLLITFPSLYVFNALVGSSLRFTANLRLLVGSLGVTLAVLASFGPIVAFFSVSTTSYPFMKLLNVIIFGLSGILGIMFLLQTLHRMSIVETNTNPVTPIPANPPPKFEANTTATEAGDDVPVEVVTHTVTSPRLEVTRSPLEQLPGHLLGPHVKIVFRIWAFVFGLVGAQMGWVLRPFIGDPTQSFTWFRPRDSNFFEAVSSAFFKLITGQS